MHRIFYLLDFRKAVRPHSTRSSGEVEKLARCGQFIQHQNLAGLHQEEISYWLSQSGGYPAEKLCSCSGEVEGADFIFLFEFINRCGYLFFSTFSI